MVGKNCLDSPYMHTTGRWRAASVGEEAGLLLTHVSALATLCCSDKRMTETQPRPPSDPGEPKQCSSDTGGSQTLSSSPGIRLEVRHAVVLFEQI